MNILLRMGRLSVARVELCMTAPPRQLAALFIDFENVYYFLKNRVESDHDPNDLIFRLVRELKNLLSEEFGADCIIAHAYADFERIGDGAQGALYLLGVDTHNVLSTEHKNAADMRLCIDALETLYVRNSISLFTVIAGDRDYIPVVQHLKKHAKSVLVVGFADNLSGDLVQIVGENRIIDATSLLGPDVKFTLKPAEAKSQMIDQVLASANGATELSPNGNSNGSMNGSANGSSHEAPVLNENGLPIPDPEVRNRIGEVTFGRSKRMSDEHELQAITFMLKSYGDKNEIWVGPLIHRLREEFPLLAEHERKSLLHEMEMHGAIKIIKKHGSSGPYSAIVVNWNHPNVREMYPGM